MRMIKLLVVLGLVWVATSASAITDEDRAFVDFLRGFCGETVLIGVPIPPQFKDVLYTAQLGCVERFGMNGPCLSTFTTILNLDGSYKFNATCSPIPSPEAETKGELKLP